MWNAASRHILLLFVAMALAVTACGGGNEAGDKTDSITSEASVKVERARTALEGGDYATALIIIDSIKTQYKSDINAGKEAMSLEPRAIELKTLAEMAAADSVIAYTQAELDKIRPRLVKKTTQGIAEPYFVFADASNPNLVNSTGFEVRINNECQLYIVANASGGNIGVNRLTFRSADGSSCSTQAIPAGNARSFYSDGSNLATFLPGDVAGVGAWASTDGRQIKTMTIEGTKGSKQVNVSASQSKAIADGWRYGELSERLLKSSIERERLERQLQIARDQQARMAERQ